MFPKFEFYSKNYNFMDTPDCINLNKNEVKYDSDWYMIPDEGKLLQYTKFKSTEAPFREVLEDDLVRLEYKGRTTEIIVQNPANMTGLQFELLSNATKIEIIRNVNIVDDEENE